MAMTNFSNFRVIEPETKDLALDLMEDAHRQRSAFVCFVAIWMAFNGTRPARARDGCRHDSYIRHKFSPAREAGAMSLLAASQVTALAATGRLE
jgi:hypothetical protein